MALPKTPINQNFFNADGLPPSQGTPFSIELDGGDDMSNKIRPLIGQAMNSEMLLCKFKNFMDHYGPSKAHIQPDDIEECKNALQNAALLVQTDGGLRWKAYAKPPKDMAENENEVFAPLKKVVDEIFKYAGSRRGNDYDYKLVPYEYLRSDIAGLNHKMDACIMEKSDVAVQSTNNSVAPEEFKKVKNTKHQIEVRQQIVGDCQHIMSEDPRRMFIYAITIENDRFSIWYFSRSHSVKAISFNWLSEDGIKSFIHVYLAFALATPEELGIDPYVRKAYRKNMNEAQQYIYMYPKNAEELSASVEPANEVGNATEAGPANMSTNRHSSRLAAKAAAAEAERLQAQQIEDAKRAATALEAIKFRYFKTVSSIGTTRPYCISGRITRIWRVVEIKSAIDETPVTGEVLILKDVWLDEDRATETDNLSSIFSDIEDLLTSAKEQYPGDDWLSRFMSVDKRFESFDQPAKDRLQALLEGGRYKSLFLTKIVAWQGKVSKVVSNKAAHSPEHVFAEPNITDHKPATRTTTAMGPLSVAKPRNNPPTRTTPQLEVNTMSGRTYAPKQQSRFIYQEVCTELKDLGTLGNFMDIMDQALTALQVLFCAGWIHRDISIGNVLAFEEEGRFKVKLADLEFAEKLGYSKHRSDPRTGTPYFMPVEIMSKKYLVDGYRFPAKPQFSFAHALKLQKGTPEYNRYSKFQTFQTTVESIPANATGDAPEPNAVPRYNFQHDLESLWWLILYFISRAIDHYPSRKYVKNIFKNSLHNGPVRLETFKAGISIWAATQLHPKLVTGFLNTMESLRSDMHEGYLLLEVFGLLDHNDAYSRIHGTFAGSFRELLQENEDGWKDLPLIDPSSLESMKMESPMIGSKRARDDLDVPPNPDTTDTTANKRFKVEEDDLD